MKKKNMIIPSPRLISSSSDFSYQREELAKNPTNKAAAIAKGTSDKIVFRLTGRSHIMAATPSINNIFAILLPNMFPVANPEFPSTLAITLTNNSGIVVPIEMMVKPVIKSDILNL